MKIRTSELNGPALCYAVCMIEMPHLKWGQTIGLHAHSHQVIVPELPSPKCYSPFSSWDMFGPIIAREFICLNGDDGAPDTPASWDASIFNDGEIKQSGPTPLIAAMRCYVASQLGDEVDIPDGVILVPSEY